MTVATPVDGVSPPTRNRNTSQNVRNITFLVAVLKDRLVSEEQTWFDFTALFVIPEALLRPIKHSTILKNPTTHPDRYLHTTVDHRTLDIRNFYIGKMKSNSEK